MSVCGRFDPITASTAPSCAVCSRRSTCRTIFHGPGYWSAMRQRGPVQAAVRRPADPERLRIYEALEALPPEDRRKVNELIDQLANRR